MTGRCEGRLYVRERIVKENGSGWRKRLVTGRCIN